MAKILPAFMVVALLALTSADSSTPLLDWLTETLQRVDWWENSSLYQIYPRSWKDSDGNGIGDINGITEKLDYLNEIGITATWLSPIFKSPMADNGYDISNFTDIDPIFGTMEDFDALMQKAKSIGLKIILDFVPNHSSDECEWFQKSINREDGYDDYYIWADGIDDPQNPGKKLPPSNWVSVFNGSMWTWNDKRQQFYLHQFLNKQPDFNFRNPNVRETMLDVLKFWLDRGVDGFRIDAVPHMFEKVNEDGSYPDEPPTNHIYTQDQYETVELLYEWRNFLEAYKNQNGGETRVLLAEAYSPITTLDQYMGNGTHRGAQIPFNFNLWGLSLDTNAYDVQGMVDGWMNMMWKKHKTANWVTGNHDMGRVLDRVGPERRDLINILLVGLPGVTITYYGEEIGMSNIVTCVDCSYEESRAFSRGPFQWSDEVSAGFSTSNQTWLPVHKDFEKVNVRAQRNLAVSSLNIFKSLQRLKHTAAFKALKKTGGFSYRAVNDQVFEIIRGKPSDQYRFLINFGENIEEIGSLISSEKDKDTLMEYTVVSERSPHQIGHKIKLGKIILMPLEGAVFRKVNN